MKKRAREIQNKEEDPDFSYRALEKEEAVKVFLFHEKQEILLFYPNHPFLTLFGKKKRGKIGNCIFTAAHKIVSVSIAAAACMGKEEAGKMGQNLISSSLFLFKNFPFLFFSYFILIISRSSGNDR